MSIFGWLRKRRRRQRKASWWNEAVAQALADEGGDPEQIRRWKAGEHVLLHEMFGLPDYRKPRSTGMPRRDPMPSEFQELAAYNARVADGIGHDPEYAAKMAGLQAQFNAWNEWQMLKQGFRPLEEVPSAWVREPRHEKDEL